MKLLYVYVQSFGKLLKNEDFKFSNEYIITYSKNNEMLNICRNVKYLDEFYGKVISDITAIVGKNGVGKTTLLNLIGLNMNNRLELSNINKNRKISDGYFIIYHVKNNIFYCESVGNIKIRNMKGNLNTNNKTVFKSFYFEMEDNSFNIIIYDNTINDKILYINNNYIESTHDLVSAILSEQDENSFLTRIKMSDTAIDDWYLAYINLCKYNMVTSTEITIIFRKNENVKYEDSFIVKPAIMESSYNVDSKISYIREDIGDFYSHFMSCIVNYYIKVSGNICDEKIQYQWNELDKVYGGKIKYTKADYKAIFMKCSKIIKNNESVGKSIEIRIVERYIQLVSNMFYELYDLRQYIIPGIDEFQLKVSGKNKNDKLEKFFCAFMEIKEFIIRTFVDNTEKEELLYETYNGSDLNIELPIDIYRTNISSGEKNLIDLLSHISYEVKEYSKSQSMISYREEKTYIILIDEIEDSMHLEWSRGLINFIITYIENQTLNVLEHDYSYVELGVKVQLIFTTHSPFLLSDLNRNSIIALELKNGSTRRKKDICAFAQNIQRIMNNEFFIQDCYGTFAQIKIKKIIEGLNSEEKLSNDDKRNINLIIDEIGEPLLKNKLYEMYMNKLIKDNDTAGEEIKLINKLKAIYGNLGNEELIEKLKMLIKDEN